MIKDQFQTTKKLLLFSELATFSFLGESYVLWA